MVVIPTSISLFFVYGNSIQFLSSDYCYVEKLLKKAYPSSFLPMRCNGVARAATKMINPI